MTLIRWTLPLRLGTKWFPGWFIYQKLKKPHRVLHHTGCKEKAQLKIAFSLLGDDQSMLVNDARSLCTVSLSIMACVEVWIYCITSLSSSILNTFVV